MKHSILHAALLGTTLLLSGQAAAAKLYVTDSAGKAVRDGSGGCVTAGGGSTLAECGSAPAPAPVAAKPAPAPVAPPAPVPAPAPTPVVMDSDGDGVSDDRDLCDNTVAGAPVDATGCTEKLVAQNISFVSGKAELTAEGLAIVDVIAAKVASNPAIASVTISGHTDSRGSYETNQRLSEKRASAVRDRLIAQGVNGDIITAVGKGEMEPIESNMYAPGRAKNRRVEFEFTMK